jgi:hypothetical protein
MSAVGHTRDEVFGFFSGGSTSGDRIDWYEFQLNDPLHRTVFLYAIQGHVETTILAEIFSKMPFNMEFATDQNGVTALDYAIMYGGSDCVRVVLNLISDWPRLLRTQDIWGQLPLHYAVHMCSLSNHRDNVYMVGMLLHAVNSADAFAPDRNGRNPLHLAVDSGLVVIVEMLLDRAVGLRSPNANVLDIVMNCMDNRRLRPFDTVVHRPSEHSRALYELYLSFYQRLVPSTALQPRERQSIEPLDERVSLNEGDDMCIACLEVPRDTRFLCGHSCLCETCFQEWTNRAGGAVPCPICRRRMGIGDVVLGPDISQEPIFVRRI